MISSPDWDAPARDVLAVVALSSADLEDETGPGYVDVVGLVGAVFGMGASAHSQLLEVRDRRHGWRIALIDAGQTVESQQYALDAAARRLQTLSVAEFLAEYVIEPEVLEAERVRAFLGIGSNLGDRLAFLQGAVDGLAATDGVEVVDVSAVHETDPVGPDQPDYLNAVVAVDTTLTPHGLLGVGQGLEAAAERVRGERWGPRTLDVDILLFGDVELDTPDLVVPHPRWRERDFVLAPLADLGYPGVAVRDWNGVRPTGLTLRVP